jgi:hypothetical protein
MSTVMTAAAISNSPWSLSLISFGALHPSRHSERVGPRSVRPIRPLRPMLQRAMSASGTGACAPHHTTSGSALRPTNGKPVKPRRLASHASSAQVLAMLTRQPVYSSPVPRFHVEPRVIDGTLLVDDRASGEQFKVYTPRFVSQFLAGHRAGFWYLRPATDVGSAPRSLGFASARAAIEALRATCWSPSATDVDRHRAYCHFT